LIIFSIFIKFRSQFVIVYMVINVIRMYLRLLIVLIIICWVILTCFFNLIICKRRLKFIIISMIYQMFLIRFTQFLIVSIDLNYIIFILFILFVIFTESIIMTLSVWCHVSIFVSMFSFFVMFSKI